MQLVGMMMDCRLCRELKDAKDLEWVVMTNKELCIKMLIHYGTHIPSVCSKCRVEFNLPIYNPPEKVRIPVLRDTRQVLKFLMEQHNHKSYDALLRALVHDSGFGGTYLDKYVEKYSLNKEWIKKEEVDNDG